MAAEGGKILMLFLEKRLFIQFFIALFETV
jgi:hypothetical protein